METATDYHALPSGSDVAPPTRARVLTVCIAVFLIQYSQSQAMIAPFVAASAAGKAVGSDMVGVIFSAYPLATALATPLPPVAINCCSLRGAVALGLCLTALANALFGAAGHCFEGSPTHEAWAFVLGPLLTVARALGGVGAALSEAGCLTAVSTAGWGDDLGKALSAIEVTTGIGAAIGAAMGGWLYALGGFWLPMAAGAVLPLVVLPVAVCFLPRTAHTAAATDSAKTPLATTSADAAPAAAASAAAAALPTPGGSFGARAGGVGGVGRLATCASLFMAAAVFEGLNPLLEPHLHEPPYFFDVEGTGALLATICLVYTLFALPVGWLTDIANHGPLAGCRLRALMLIGWVATFATAILLAPGGGGGPPTTSADGLPSLWPLEGGAAQLALACATPLLGAAAAIVIIPSLPDMQRGLAEDDPAADRERASLCALWNGAYAGGSAVGPLLATMLYARCGWASIVLAQAVVSLVAFAMLSLVACAQATQRRPRTDPAHDPDR